MAASLQEIILIVRNFICSIVLACLKPPITVHSVGKSFQWHSLNPDLFSGIA